MAKEKEQALKEAFKQIEKESASNDQMVNLRDFIIHLQTKIMDDGQILTIFVVMVNVMSSIALTTEPHA